MLQFCHSSTCPFIVKLTPSGWMMCNGFMPSLSFQPGFSRKRSRRKLNFVSGGGIRSLFEFSRLSSFKGDGSVVLDERRGLPEAEGTYLGGKSMYRTSRVCVSTTGTKSYVNHHGSIKLRGKIQVMTYKGMCVMIFMRAEASKHDPLLQAPALRETIVVAHSPTFGT
jgi:hypothetical protein